MLDNFTSTITCLRREGCQKGRLLRVLNARQPTNVNRHTGVSLQAEQAKFKHNSCCMDDDGQTDDNEYRSSYNPRFMRRPRLFFYSPKLQDLKRYCSVFRIATVGVRTRAPTFSFAGRPPSTNYTVSYTPEYSVCSDINPVVLPPLAMHR